MSRNIDRIYKYKMMPNIHVELPKGAQILSVGLQDEEVYLWVKVNPNEQKNETRMFLGRMTGHDISNDMQIHFIGTVFFKSGMVFHIFEQLGQID